MRLPLSCLALLLAAALPVFAADPPAPAKKAPAKTAAKKAGATGAAIGENKATPVDRIKVPAGFRVELLYSVPNSEQGSWVALCTDSKGRIYASDQYGALYRFPAPAAGQPLKATDVQKLAVSIRGINGMVFAFGALYVGVNDYEKKIPSGVYRLSDTNSDDSLDKVELLREIQASGDHGVHAIVPTPDGKALYLITGNNAVKPETAANSPVPTVWGDDHLLPRMPDGRGHNRHVLAPGGIVYRFTPDGKEFKVFASGFRNIYGGAVNKDGELFTYDADMEYDFNTPWYRPTRINHVVSGGEYGWRNGAGKYPEFYPDNLPATLNIGPGSPTGMTFGYGAKFPAKYQQALYALDWSWGKIYAVHLAPKGASYTATKEEFVTGGPLPVTDAFIHPKDGAMYFAIGGRKVQSGLYRVSYIGKESTAGVDVLTRPTDEAKLRQQLEAYHGVQDPKSVDLAWPHLNSADRNIRWAARTVLEHQPLEQWQDRAMKETDAARSLEALLAVARVGAQCPNQSPRAAKPDPRTGVPLMVAQPTAAEAATRDAVLDALLRLEWPKLTNDQRIAWVRISEIVLHRYGMPAAARVQQIVDRLDPAFPANNFELNWVLCETLAFLQAPNTAAKGMALIANAESQEPQMEYARSLRFLKTGWTPALRQAQLNWFLQAANYRGGSSFTQFIQFIRNDSLATFTDAEKTSHAELISRKPEPKSAIENVGAMFAGRTPKNWTLEELSAAASTGMKNRDFAQGRKAFSAAACFTCHRFGNAGGMTGPDLSGAGGRYSPHDFLDQIINPSKVLNEQFIPIVVTKNDGTVLTGVVVNLNGDRVSINTDASDPIQQVAVDRKDVKSIELSTVSPMPPMLLNMLTQEEILDLVAYVLSGGDKNNAYFKK